MTSDASSLPPGKTGGYPSEPPGSWPTDEWPEGEASTALGDVFDEAFDESGPLAITRAALVVQGGRVLLERYASALPSFIDEPTPVTEQTPLLSWSMAKSVLAVLIAHHEAAGRLNLDSPPPVPEWSDDADPRSAITWNDLLEMRDGLDFVEDYTPGGRSDILDMLFGAGVDDQAHFAAMHAVAHRPGEVFNYSSGTSNLLSRSLATVLGGEVAMRASLTDDVFGPLSMASAEPTFDEAGTFLASSYVHATARDWARFGLMLCRGGLADGREIVPRRWVDRWRTPASADEEGDLYSAHFWVVGDELGTFYASGFEGQRIVVCPPLDAVVVRLGSTPHERTAEVTAWSRRLLAQLSLELPS